MHFFIHVFLCVVMVHFTCVAFTLMYVWHGHLGEIDDDLPVPDCTCDHGWWVGHAYVHICGLCLGWVLAIEQLIELFFFFPFLSFEVKKGYDIVHGVFLFYL